MSKTVKTLTDSETETLFNYLLRHHREDSTFSVPFRNYLIALMMFDTGIRVGELVQLLQTDLWKHEEVVANLYIRDAIAKGGRGRVIPLTERLKVAILIMESNYWRNQVSGPGGYAFYAFHSSQKLHVRQVQRIIKVSSEACLRRVVTPHMLRHTFATRLMRTCSTRIVQELLGHKNLSSTQVYTHPNHTDLTKAIQSLK